jgi:hypothetical protein
MMIKSSMKNLFILILGIYFLSSALFAATATNNSACYSTAELNDFKTIYIKLQQQLNYEGKDAYLDKNFQVQLEAHKPGTSYGGKDFELAMFKEYQNSLRKVGRLYQAGKFEGDDTFKSNPTLVAFMEAIEKDSDSSAAFIKQTDIKKVIQALQEASVKKFGNTTDGKFVLNDGDKYLLEKLLTHAQDRICNLITYENNGHKDTYLFKADYMQKVMNAPLNRLVNTLRNASLTKDSKIDIFESSPLTGSLVDPKAVIQSALAENVNQLSEWVKKVKARGDKCLASLKTKAFANSIQANIQSCNLGHFIDTLSAENVSNLESVLHFINSNERLLNFAQAKAETAMDELELESVINKTFSNLGTKVGCTIVAAEGGKKKMFVRNVDYKDNKFDTSKFTCTLNSKKVDCGSKLEFVSDEFGRGIEVRQRAKSGPVIKISVTDNPKCDGVDLNTDTPKIKTEADCKKEGEAKNPKQELVLSDDKQSCVPKAKLKSDDDCKKEGEAKNPKEDLVPSEDKKSCVPKVKLKTDDECKKEGEAKNPKEDLMPSEDKKSCVPRVKLKTEADCKAEGEAKTPKVELVLSEDKKSCIPKDSALMTDEKCKAVGDKRDPKEILVPSDDKKDCVAPKNASEEDCVKKQDKWVEESNNGRYTNEHGWIWNKKTNQCEDKTSDKTSDKKEAAGDLEKPQEEIPLKTPPGRFQPINIPLKQTYILPGQW